MTIHDDLREVMGLLEALLYRADLVSDQVATAAAEGGMHPDYPAIERLCQRTAAYQEAYAAFEPHKAALFALLRDPALLAAAKYEEANPLGGPATMLEAAARRIRAGEDFNEVLADYGLLARQEGEDARDAARYRWLKANFQADYCRSTSDYWRITGEHDTPQELHIGNGELTLDYLVDAVRSGGGG